MGFVRQLIADRLSPAGKGIRTAEEIPVDVLSSGGGRLEVLDVDHGTSQRSQLLFHPVEGASVPLFVKNTPTGFAARALNGLTQLCEREVAFYQDIAPVVASVPQAVFSQWDQRTGRSTLVLPDLRGQGFEFSPASVACTPDQAAAALDALADVHASVTRDIQATRKALYDTSSSGARRMSRVAASVVGRGSGAIGKLVPPDVLEASKVLRTHAKAYPLALASFPSVFCHNDTHRGNMGFSEDRAVLIDWQGCGWGPALKDAAYLLSTSLSPEDRRAHENSLVKAYTQQLAAAGGPAFEWDDAWFAYRVLAVTGYVAAAVTALFGERLQAAANAKEGLARACAAVSDLESFSALRAHMDSLTRHP